MKCINHVWCVSLNKTVEKGSLIHAREMHERILGQPQKSLVLIVLNDTKNVSLLFKILFELYEAILKINSEKIFQENLMAITRA